MLSYQKKRFIGLGFVCLVGLVCFSGKVDAYVLPGPLVLKRMISHLGKARGLMVKQTQKLYDQKLKKGPVEIAETLRYLFPGKFRSDIFSKDTHRIHLVSYDKSLTVLDGKVVADSETRFDRYKDIFLYHSLLLLQTKLSLLGVDVGVTSLGRFQGRTAFVIGAEYPDESACQVWIEKATFRPFRWVVTARNKAQKDSLEVRYGHWVKKENVWYPKQIVFYQNDVLVREIAVHDLQVKPGFPDNLFDIERLRLIHPPADSIQTGAVGGGGESEIKKTIEEFKKIYE